MHLLAKGVKRVSAFLNTLAGTALVAMTAITCADVVLRLFRRPILGSYEIVGFLGATAAGLAMAHTTLERGHVAVAVLIMNLPRAVQRGVYLLVQALSLILFGLLSWESLRYGRDLKASGEVSLTLEWPFFPVLYGLSAASLVVCLVLAVDFLQVAAGKERPWYRWKE